MTSNVAELNKTEEPQASTSQSVFLQDKDKVLTYPANLDEHDIGHNVRVGEYGEDPIQSSATYLSKAAETPISILGNLKDSLLTKIGLHPDKDVIGARAVIALNEIEKVRGSGLPDEEQGKEVFLIHEDMDKYLAGKGVYTRSTQNLAMNDFMLNVGMAALGGGAITKYGAIAFTKGLIKFAATNAALKYGVFPALKATSIPEGQDYEYKPLALSELLGIKTEETGLKTGADIIEMGLSGVALLTPKMIQNAKITSVVKEALPKLTELFNSKGIKIPQEGLNVNYVMQIAKQSPELGTAIIQASNNLPFYKALGNRGSALIPDFKPGDEVKIGEGLAKVIKVTGEEVTLSIGGKEIVQKVADIAKSMKPLDIPAETSKPAVSGEPELKKGFAWQPRGFISSIQDEMPELKVSGQYVPRSTDRLAMKAKTLIKEDLPMAEKMAKTGTDDAAIATGAELLKFYSQEAEKQNIAGDLIAETAYYDKAAELGNDMAKRLTELGRSVQAASILARLTPEGQIKFAAKTIQKYNEEVIKDNGGLFGLKKTIPELTSEQVKDIIENMKEIADMPDGEEKAIKFRDLQNYISDLVPTPLYNKVVAVWKAGLLTGLKTSGVNILANFSHAFGAEVIKDIPATLVDSVASLFRELVLHKPGERTVAFNIEGTLEGIKEGFNKGVRFLKTGYDERNVLTKLDYQRVNFGKSKFAKGLQAYEESVFKLLGAEDQPFYYGAKARSIYEQAKVAAINKGLKGKEAKAFIDDLVANPTDEIILNAVSDAEIAVFQNKTALSNAAGQLRKIKGAELVIPFTKTPSAVAMQILNYTPIGAAKTIFENIGKGKWNQRDFSKGFGRAILGTGVLALGAYLLRKGLINLNRPKSESEQKMWDLEGRSPNTIKIGGKYRQIQILGPVGNVLLIGAQFQNAFNKSGSVTEALAKGSWGSLKSFTEQTFVKGISTALGSLTDPEKQSEAFFSGLVSSVVPTLAKDIAVGTDQKQRRAENILQKLMERVPLLRKVLEPQIDAFGNEKMRKENFLEVLADPTRPSTEQTEPVVQEIRRLMDAGNRISISQPGDKEGFKVLTQQQNTELWQRSGQLAYDKISSLMSISGYANAADDIKAKKINEIFDKSKIIARAEKVVEITQGFSGEDLKVVLSEAKKDGLLNREVFNYYQKLR